MDKIQMVGRVYRENDTTKIFVVDMSTDVQKTLIDKKIALADRILFEENHGITDYWYED